MSEQKYTVTLTEVQCELIKKALDAYEYTTSNVMNHAAILARMANETLPIYDQLPV